MKYIVFIFFLINSASISAQTNNIVLKEFVTKWKNAQQYTIKVVELMPENGYDFKPTDDEMTFTEQVEHLSKNMTWLSSSFLTTKKAAIIKNGNSKSEIILFMNTSFEFAENAIKELDATEMDTTIDFNGEKLTKRQIIMLMNDHLTHHRAQIIVYLRLKGIKPPNYIGY